MNPLCGILSLIPSIVSVSSLVLLILDLDGLRWLGWLLVGAKLALLLFLTPPVFRVIIMIFKHPESIRDIEVIVIVIDRFNLEAGGVVRLESWETTISSHLESAGFTLRKGDVDVLLLAHGVEGESCIVAATVALEGAYGLGKGRVGISA